MIAVVGEAATVSIVTLLFSSIIYLAVAISKLRERIAKLEGILEGKEGLDGGKRS